MSISLSLSQKQVSHLRIILIGPQPCPRRGWTVGVGEQEGGTVQEVCQPFQEVPSSVGSEELGVRQKRQSHGLDPRGPGRTNYTGQGADAQGPEGRDALL